MGRGLIKLFGSLGSEGTLLGVGLEENEKETRTDASHGEGDYGASAVWGGRLILSVYWDDNP